MDRPDFFFGVRLHIPSVWSDHSIYRFAMPKEEETRHDSPVLSRKIKELHANVIVTRLSLAPEQSFEQIFEDANAVAREQDVVFEVVASGQGESMGQSLLWQDCYKSHPTHQTSLYQRHIAFSNPWGDVVLCTITGTHRDVEDMTQAMGIELVGG